MSEFGKAILVTGVLGGVGSALREQFEKGGYYVIGTDILPDSRGDSSSFFQVDLSKFVTDPHLRREFRAQIVDWLNHRGVRLQGIVNNAAVQILGGVEDLSLQDFEDTLRVNLSAPLMLTQLFLPELKGSRGSIINIGSIHAKLTKADFVSYATSKSALRGLTQAMAVDLGAQGIRVNVIEPAALGTEMLKAGFEGKSDQLVQLQNYHPTGKIGDPAEVAKLSVFLMSPDCPFMTGAVVPLDGGIGVRLHDPD